VHAIRCGDLLVEAKKGIAHGEWTAWLAANTSICETTARGYMRLASLDSAKRQRVADMSFRQALKQVGVGYNPRQRRIEKKVDRDLRDEKAAASPEQPPVVYEGVATRTDDALSMRATVVDTKIERAAPDSAGIIALAVEPEPTGPKQSAPTQKTRKKPDVERMIDKATVAIVHWFEVTDPGDHQRLADALCAVIAERVTP
jgi:hypothetical protein